MSRRLALAAASALALGVCAAPAFAITGMFEGEPAPERTVRARAEPLTGSPDGYVGYAPPAAVEPLPSVDLPASAAAEAAQAQDAPEREAARAEARRLLMTDTMNPIADSPADEINRIQRSSPALRELLHSRFGIMDISDSSPSAETVAHELGHQPPTRPDYYHRMPGAFSSWYGEPPAASPDAQPAAEPAPVPPEPSAPAPSRARLQELVQRARQEKGRLAAFWNGARRARVHVGRKSFPLTYSLDSELGGGDAFRIIERDPVSLAELDQTLGPPVAPAKLAAILDLDVKQLERFALKPGVARGAEAYRYSDLRPSYFGAAVESAYYNVLSGRLTVGTMKRITAQAVSRVGLPRKAGDESPGEGPVPLVGSATSSDLELAHASWEDIPRRFGSLIRHFHGVLSEPNTHLHIGLPSAIGKDATVAVARAVETLMILELASANPSHLAEQIYRYSTLTTSAYDRVDDARGLINLRFGEWETPHLTDNLELRFYPDIETGLRWQALAGELARRHGRLKVFRRFEPRWTMGAHGDRTDRLTVNLPSALEYAALLLEGSPDADTRPIAADLRQLSDSAGREVYGPAGQISLELRAKISRYLRSRRVRERMTMDVFLQPAVSPPTSPTTP